MRSEISVLVVSGHDPMAGAGLLADCAVLRDFGVSGYCVPTCLVPQNSRGVGSVAATDTDSFRHALDLLLDDVQIDVVKVGVVPNEAVAGALMEATVNLDAPVIFDPVLRGGTVDGKQLTTSISDVTRQLAVFADVITPNREEAEQIIGGDVVDMGDEALAEALAFSLDSRVVMTGGHSVRQGVDIVAQVGAKTVKLEPGCMIPDLDVHGTGCHFSTTLAVFLASGLSLVESTIATKRYVENLIEHCQVFPGRGRAQFVHDTNSSEFAKALLTSSQR